MNKTLVLRFALVTLIVFLAGCGGSGGGSSEPAAPSDTLAPNGYSVSFDSDSVTAANQSSISFSVSSAELNASYSYEITGGNSAVNGSGTVSNGSFTVSGIDVSSLPDGTLSLSFQLTDAAGNQGQSATASIEKNASDTEAPSGYSVAINQASIDTGNQSALSFNVQNAEIDAEYTYEISSGSVVVNGSGTVASSSFTVSSINVSGLPDGTLTLSFSLRDIAGNEGASVTDTVVKNTSTNTVVISGSLTFDLVPHLTVGNGLDYDNIVRAPIRGLVVEAASASGNVLSSTLSDANGAYSLVVDASTDVRIQVKAQMLQTTGARWDVEVTDNTNGNALYVLAGSVVSSGTSNSTRDLHADSGWGGSSYTGARSAGPFAILSPIYDTLQKFALVDPTINFPGVEFRWSVNNSTASGNLTAGDIGTSFYSAGNIYILGKEDSDSDEYDGHIVVHEWGHYFEDRLSRSDSIGGQHGLGDRLDMRVAFGEGFGNALSGIITDDPFYRDSFGSQQASAFFINVENNNNQNSGWFNEGSVQSILYDLYDSDDDGADNLSLGLKPIYDTLVDPDYTQNQWFTSIFSFINQYRANLTDVSAATTDVPALVQSQDIFGTGDDGQNETNDGGLSGSLPVYISMSAAGSPYEICSVDNNGIYNKLGNRVYGQIQFVTSGSHTLQMTRISGETNRDPDFILSSAGNVIRRAESPDVDTETLTANFNAGTLILEAYDFKNVDTNNTSGRGDSCYEFSIQEN